MNILDIAAVVAILGYHGTNIGALLWASIALLIIFIVRIGRIFALLWIGLVEKEPYDENLLGRWSFVSSYSLIALDTIRSTQYDYIGWMSVPILAILFVDLILMTLIYLEILDIDER